MSNDMCKIKYNSHKFKNILPLKENLRFLHLCFPLCQANRGSTETETTAMDFDRGGANPNPNARCDKTLFSTHRSHQRRSTHHKPHSKFLCPWFQKLIYVGLRRRLKRLPNRRFKYYLDHLNF